VNCDAVHGALWEQDCDNTVGNPTLSSERNVPATQLNGVMMGEHILGANAGRGHSIGVNREDAAAHAILEGSPGPDHSLEQVREILFGAESRRSETERRALESKVAERFDRLEAEYERRFEKLLAELHQRFEKNCSMLEAEAAERREALRIQHDELVRRLEAAAELMRHTKTDRQELADLLTDVASRLRAAATTA